MSVFKAGWSRIDGGYVQKPGIHTSSLQHRRFRLMHSLAKGAPALAR